jgi:hypothetical protein
MIKRCKKNNDQNDKTNLDIDDDRQLQQTTKTDTNNLLYCTENVHLLNNYYKVHYYYTLYILPLFDYCTIHCTH